MQALRESLFVWGVWFGVAIANTLASPNPHLLTNHFYLRPTPVCEWLISWGTCLVMAHSFRSCELVSIFFLLKVVLEQNNNAGAGDASGDAADAASSDEIK